MSAVNLKKDIDSLFFYQSNFVSNECFFNVIDRLFYVNIVNDITVIIILPENVFENISKNVDIFFFTNLNVLPPPIAPVKFGSSCRRSGCTTKYY